LWGRAGERGAVYRRTVTPHPALRADLSHKGRGEVRPAQFARIIHHINGVFGTDIRVPRRYPGFGVDLLKKRADPG
jgi:hypothetical protein